MRPASAAAVPPPFTVKAVLFDLDGTLVHSAPDLAAAVNLMLRDLGRAEAPVERIVGWIGNGVTQLVRRALADDAPGARQDEPAALLDRALALFKRHYAANLSVDSRPYPGAVDMLEKLSARGFRLGCVTNKAEMFTVPLLRQLRLASYFGVVVCGDSTPARKPDPAPLHHACRLFGIDASQTALVGDSANDVQAARAAGMPVICVSYGYRQGRDVRELAPDAVVDSLDEVPQYLQLQTIETWTP